MDKGRRYGTMQDFENFVKGMGRGLNLTPSKCNAGPGILKKTANQPIPGPGPPRRLSPVAASPRKRQTSNDPLLQPYRLKHLTLRNRIMTTSHKPAYPEDGMPKDRYRAYHQERAKAGIALTMTAGSAAGHRPTPQ